METIKFETNMPQVLALAFTEGKAVESQFTGPQVMFSTVDGRRMYLAPFVAEKIKAAGIVARTPFEICRKQVGRSIEWQVRTHNAGAVSEATPAPVQQSPKQTALQGSALQGYNGNAHQAMMATALDATYTAMAQPDTRTFSARAKRMMAAMIDAVDVVIETEMYLERRGVESQAEFESIRAIAATFFIQESKGGAA